jgi:hypothetical protein
MRANYGASFDRQWECPAGTDPVAHVAEMRLHWGRELRYYQQSPHAIAYALEHLPEFPPNLPQFKALCVRRPDHPEVKQLPPPPADPAQLERVRVIAKGIRIRHDREWAHRLAERAKAGFRLTITQRDMLREVMRDAESEAEEA